jgi:SAM-dependent methyltransferase
MLKSLYKRLTHLPSEQCKVLAFVAQGGVRRRILDIGCGYGRNLTRLIAAGHDVLGVEINADIVKANVASGLPCVTPEEYEKDAAVYDVMLMSHFIEHFTPTDLHRVIDRYLDRLKVGGELVIATPLMSNNFYDDFDHVRPYQPLGLQMVFGGTGAQVQYYARNRLALRDVWFRRSPWRMNHCRARHVFGPTTRALQILDLLSVLVFRLTFGFLGRTDGWVGRFQKLG